MCKECRELRKPYMAGPFHRTETKRVSPNLDIHNLLEKLKLTFTLRMLHESHAFRRRFVFCGCCSGVEVCVGAFEWPPALVGWLVTGVGC